MEWGGPFGRTGRDTSLLCLPCRRASCAPLDDVVRRQAAAGVGGRALAGVSNHLGIAPYLSRRSRILTLAGGFTCSYVQRLTYAQLRYCTLFYSARADGIPKAANGPGLPGSPRAKEEGARRETGSTQ